MRRLPTGEQVVGRIERHTTRKAASPKPPTPTPGAAALEDLLSGRFFKPARALESPGKTLAAGRAPRNTFPTTAKGVEASSSPSADVSALRAVQRRRVESLVFGALSSSPVHRALVLVSGTNIAVLLGC